MHKIKHFVWNNKYVSLKIFTAMEEIKKESIETKENVTPVTEPSKEELLAQVAELTALKVESEVKVANLEKQVKELKESKEFWIKSYNEYEEKYSTFKKDVAAIAQILNTLTK